MASAAASIALSLGTSALLVAGCRRIRIPAMLPLLGAGVAMGVSGAGVVDAGSLGDALNGFIKVAIGLLIFEGALHLNREELGRAPRAVWGLLTAGAAITWAGAAVAAHLLLGMSWPIALVLGAALIVTGPTVVQPIIRVLRLSPRLQTTLGAEAVLIDPIGVVATVTTLEVVRLWLTTGLQPGLAGEGLWIFAKPLLSGAGIGTLMGFAGYGLLTLAARSGKAEPQVLNLIAIGTCMACVGIGEAVTHEAGLAAVTICGVIMARARILGASELRAFKELLAVLLVGTLFVLLASRVEIGRISALGWPEVAFVATLLLVVRPACVLASTHRSRLDWRERAFAATFAPRGIVALSVAAVAANDLLPVLNDGGGNVPLETAVALARDAERLEVVMFATIVGTVVAASTLSPALAWALRVRQPTGSSTLLIGGHALSVALAKALASRGVRVRIVDSNAARVASAQADGLDAVAGDATDPRWMDDRGAPSDLGTVIAWTGNHDVDQLAGRWAIDRLGPADVGVWSSRPVRGALAEAELGGGASILSTVDRVESGAMGIGPCASEGPSAHRLGWIDGGRFRPATGAARAVKLRQSEPIGVIPKPESP